MWVNSLYSYPYLNQQKPLFLPIIAYTLSITKLEIRANSFCWVLREEGTEWVVREGVGTGEKWPKPCMHIWIKKKKTCTEGDRAHSKFTQGPLQSDWLTGWKAWASSLFLGFCLLISKMGKKCLWEVSEIDTVLGYLVLIKCSISTAILEQVWILTAFWAEARNPNRALELRVPHKARTLEDLFSKVLD
jgi:hypothetical protein